MFLQSVLFRISRTRSLIFRRSDVEAVTQGKRNASRVVILRLSKYHSVKVERAFVHALIKKVIAR